MASEATIYNGLDNQAVLLLSSTDLSAVQYPITRVKISYQAAWIDSSINPTYFDLSVSGQITLMLGLAGLSAGRCMAKLVVYSLAYPDGLYWGEFTMNVIDLSTSCN